jgi:predicted DNA-binding transcriptional regulator YafY
MTLQMADTRELPGWIVSFGSGVQVVKPDRLQHAVKEEARKLLAQ